MRKSYALVASLFFVGQSSSVMAAEIRQTIPPQEVAVTEDQEGFAEFSGEDIQFLTLSGEPQIPSHVIRLMLPADADLESVSVSIEDELLEEVPGEWEIRPVPPMAFWDGTQVVTLFPEEKTIRDGRDVDIYESDAFFPPDVVGEVRIGELRGALVIEIPVASHQWNPVTKKLVRLAEADLVITFNRGELGNTGGDLRAAGNSSNLPSASNDSRRRLDPIAKKRARRILRNYDMVDDTYGSVFRERFEPRSLYVILTTKEIWSNSTELEDFAIGKKDRGFAVAVVTEDIWGGGQGNAAADNIRAWLATNYARRNIEYVLLIGNPHPDLGDVPMKMLWPRRNAVGDLTFRQSPSDFYYADLTDNWDLDGDGFFGEAGQPSPFPETSGDFGTGGIDRNWEVLVGRIPFYGDYSELDGILTKISSYESASRGAIAWRENVLIPMEPSDASTPGFRLGEAIKDDIVVPKNWDFYRIYDDDFGLVPPPETVPTTVDNVTAVWRAEPFGAVFWFTHGSATSASGIMNSSRALELNDDFPSFTFQASCCNAFPEIATNLAYSILLNGGIGTVGATRISWYFPGQSFFANSAGNQGMTYEYARRLIAEEMNAGDALYDLKESIIPAGDGLWMNYTDYNLYGDPSVGLFTFRGSDLLAAAE